MNEWRKYNQKLKEAVEQPTKKNLLQMDQLHLSIYELNQEKIAIETSLNEVNEELKGLYDKVDKLLKSKNPPKWAWIWYFKKSNIAWKQEFIKRLGEAEANKVSSIAKQEKYPKIGIKFIDPDPESLPKTPIQKQKEQPIKRLQLTNKPALNLKERIQQLKQAKSN